MTNDQDPEFEHQVARPAGKPGEREQPPSGRPCVAAPEDELFRDPFGQRGASAR